MGQWPLRAATRKEDMASRYGGEGFGAVLVEADRAALAVGVGEAMTRGDEGGDPGLLRPADGRLYQAKRGGRDRLVDEGEPGDIDGAVIPNPIDSLPSPKWGGKAMKRLPVVLHLTNEEVDRRYRSCYDAAERSRRHVLRLVTRSDNRSRAPRPPSWSVSYQIQ